MITAKKLPSGGHQRAADRFDLQLKITAEILIPEDTFRPHALEGHTLDVSSRGMQVQLDGLQGDLFSRLLVRPRHIRIAFDNPATGKQIKLTGRIAWLDYRKKNSSESAGPCNLGVAFSEKEDRVDLTAYADFIASIRPE